MSAAEATAFRSYLDKWLEAEPDGQLLRLFVPAAREPETAARLVLMHELQSAAFGLEAQPAQAKLAWWQEELGRWRAGAPRHPIALALGVPDAKVATLPAIAARWLRLETVGRFEQWLEIASELAAAEARALGGAGERADPATTLARVASRYPRLAVDPRGLLPLDVLAEAGANRAEVAAAPDGSASKRVLAALARRALAVADPTDDSSELAVARAFLARRALEHVARGRDLASATRPGLGAVLGLRRALRRARAGR